MINEKKWIEYYEDLFPTEPNQLEYFQDLSKSYTYPTKILSVECGPALITRQMSTEHLDITVTDSIAGFIDKVKNYTIPDANQFHAFNLNPADLGRYLGKAFFNIIMCCNYRLIFMKDRALIQKFLMDAKLLLSDNGVLILDLINFSKYDFTQTKVELPVKKSDEISLYSSLVRETETPKYRLYQQVITNTGKVIDVVKDEEVCPIGLETFRVVANELNYSSIEFYSDYYKSPFRMESDKIICVLKK